MSKPETPLQSLVAAGTKLWLDSVDPDEIARNRAWGATGATSNPIIVGDIIKQGRYDDQIVRLLEQGLDDDAIAWQLTDDLVRQAQEVFLPVWEATDGDDGYVSFELDPLLEDPARHVSDAEKTRRYIELGKRWSQGHKNRMIKVPATHGGLGALEELAAAGVTLNVTLIFSERQFRYARSAIYMGSLRRPSRKHFKSVYSIFVSRLDVYTEKHVPQLPPRSQGQVGIVNAKRIWRENQEFWADHHLHLKQEMIFASTGTKKPSDPPWKYVEAFAGSDIETNPPATNLAVQESGRFFQRHVDQMPPTEVLCDIDMLVDVQQMERVLMDEGIKKFADPQKTLLAQIAEKRRQLHPAGAR
ncbi:MAG TPA: transaldolase family protein [Gemmataceae bacterium]|nr:transaldolase family protein [Gemmataceae bacterium]